MGSVSGLKWERRCLFISQHFERISDFYLGGCFVMDMWWWLIFRGDKEDIFWMFYCRQVLVLVSPRWLLERCLCLLVAICTMKRRCWMRSFYIVTANSLKSQNGTLFSHVWRRGRLALDPLYNKSSFRVFSQAYKNWHIMWGINLWPDWLPLARGSKFHTIHTPIKATSLPPLEQWKIWTSRFSLIILIRVVGNSGFPYKNL